MLGEGRVFRHRYREGVLTGVSVGFFLILVGAIFVSTPRLYDRIVDFVNDFKLKNMPHTQIQWPQPEHPGDHTTVYNALAQFSLIWGVFQIATLIFRFVIRSPLNKKSETASNVAFWLGAFYLIGVFLTASITLERWFAFWASIIILFGVSLIVRAIIMVVGKIGRSSRASQP